MFGSVSSAWLLVLCSSVVAAAGRSFPTAVPYVHDPSGDGRAARLQKAGEASRTDEYISLDKTNVSQVDTASHEAALQKAALHRWGAVRLNQTDLLTVTRRQLDQVIARHMQVVSEREEEIGRTSDEEKYVKEELQARRSFKTSSSSKNGKKSDKKVCNATV